MATGTYDPSESTLVWRMRGAIGDRGEGDPPVFFIEDATYQARLSDFGDWRLGAASIADTLAREFSQRPDTFSESGEISVSWKDRAAGFFTVAKNLRAQYAQDAAAESRGFRIRRMVRSDRKRDPYEYRKGDYGIHGGVYFDD